MTRETGITSRYTARLMDAGEQEITVGDDAPGWTERHMIANHHREVAAQRSTALRTRNAYAIREQLAREMDASLQRTYADAKATIQELDPADLLDAELIDYARQRVATTKEDYLGIQQGLTETLVNRAGADIRRGIPPEPSPTVGNSNPKLRPARLLEGGKTKYVLDE